MATIDGFTELETDLLKELFNIGVGNAAASLSAMMGQSIQLTVPEVALLDLKTVLDKLSTNPMFCSVTQQMSGEFRFASTLLFPESCSLEIVRLMLNADLDEQTLIELRPEAMAEIGNILLNACIGRIALMMDCRFDVGLPSFNLNNAENIIQQTGVEHQSDSRVLMISITMLLKDSEVGGDLLFLFDTSAFNDFHRYLSSMLNDMQGGGGG